MKVEANISKETVEGFIGAQKVEAGIGVFKVEGIMLIWHLEADVGIDFTAVDWKTLLDHEDKNVIDFEDKQILAT